MNVTKLRFSLPGGISQVHVYTVHVYVNTDCAELQFGAIPGR